MADAIKRFFEKRKRDLVFKTAGAGHKLTDDTRSVAASSGGRSTSGSGASATGGLPILERHVGEISMEQRMAAEAALARTAQVKPGSASGVCVLFNNCYILSFTFINFISLHSRD